MRRTAPGYPWLAADNRYYEEWQEVLFSVDGDRWCTHIADDGENLSDVESAYSDKIEFRP